MPLAEQNLCTEDRVAIDLLKSVFYNKMSLDEAIAETDYEPEVARNLVNGFRRKLGAIDEFNVISRMTALGFFDGHKNISDDRAVILRDKFFTGEHDTLKLLFKIHETIEVEIERILGENDINSTVSQKRIMPKINKAFETQREIIRQFYPAPQIANMAALFIALHQQEIKEKMLMLVEH